MGDNNAYSADFCNLVVLAEQPEDLLIAFRRGSHLSYKGSETTTSAQIQGYKTAGTSTYGPHRRHSCFPATISYVVSHAVHT